MCSSSVSLASLQRLLYFPIVLIICLAYIFLLKPLDLSNLKSQYKAFRLFYYLLYSCYIIRLASLFYPKTYRNRQDFNQVILIDRKLYSRVRYAYLSRPLPQFSSSFPLSRPKGLGLSVSSQLPPLLIRGILLFSQVSYNRLLA